MSKSGKQEREKDGAPDNIDDAPVASQEAYEEKTQSEKWVYLPDGGMKMRVREMPPFYFLARLRKYGIEIDDAPEVEDPADFDAEDIDEEEIDMSEVTDAMGLMKEIAERVVEPTATWAGEEPDAFDLSTLSDEDISALMTGIMGEGQGEVDANSFPDG